MQQESEYLLLHIEWVEFKGSVRMKKNKYNMFIIIRNLCYYKLEIKRAPRYKWQVPI